MTDPFYPVSFIRHKITVAKRLANGDCGGWYGDAVVILSNAISALAADLFRGKGIDRRRFIQVWVGYADPSLDPVRISVPLLAQELHESGDQGSVAGLRRLRPQVFWLFPETAGTLVLHGDCDASGKEVIAACPALSSSKIREFSYPNLFYSEIRSGLVHEGDTTERGSTHPGGTRPADISYANVIHKPFRRIHFSISWLSKVAESIAENVAPEIYNPRFPLPPKWWLDGGGI